MKIFLIGYSVLDFVNDDGERVKGIKMFFAHESDRRNFYGYEIEEYFVDAERNKILYDILMNCKPFKWYLADVIPGFGKKKSAIACLHEVKES